MKNFKIAQPRSIEDVTSLLSAKKERYYLMAGGTDLIGEIKDNIVEPDVVVDLSSLANLSFIRKEKNGVRIGALTTVAELAQDQMIKKEYPGLHQAANSLASPQLRNVGTVGGNLCQRPRCWYYRDSEVICRKKGGSRCYAYRGRNRYHAILGGGLCYIVHPSDLAPMLIALEAEISIHSDRGEKTIPLEDFFILPKTNVHKENILEPGEIITEIRIPPSQTGEKSTYLKLKERETWDFAVVSAAVKGTPSKGVFQKIKIVLGGVAPAPWRMKKAEDMIKGKKATEDLLREAARVELKEANPLEENGYKKDLVETALYRATLSLI
jgi:xanthine dehydrogenase YagS FAD-binding subunit